jgi:hypothetical protein
VSGADLEDFVITERDAEEIRRLEASGEARPRFTLPPESIAQ